MAFLQTLRALLAALAVASLSYAEPRCKCDPPFLPWGQQCLHLVSASSYYAVKAACQSLSGRLDSVLSESAEQNARRTLSAFRYFEAWVGKPPNCDAEGNRISRDKQLGATEDTDHGGDFEQDCNHDVEHEVGSGCDTLNVLGGRHQRDCFNWRAIGICFTTPARRDGRDCQETGRASLVQQLEQLVGSSGGGEGGRHRLTGLPAPPPPKLELPVRETLLRREQRKLPMMDAPVMWHHWM